MASASSVAWASAAENSAPEWNWPRRHTTSELSIGRARYSSAVICTGIVNYPLALLAKIHGVVDQMRHGVRGGAVEDRLSAGATFFPQRRCVCSTSSTRGQHCADADFLMVPQPARARRQPLVLHRQGNSSSQKPTPTRRCLSAAHMLSHCWTRERLVFQDKRNAFFQTIQGYVQMEGDRGSDDHHVQVSFPP